MHPGLCRALDIGRDFFPMGTKPALRFIAVFRYSAQAVEMDFSLMNKEMKGFSMGEKGEWRGTELNR